jgi:hypothetical protein
MADGFHTAMLAGAVLAAAGAVLAWFMISDDVLERAEAPGREPCAEALETAPDYHCAVAGTPLQSVSHGRPVEDREPVGGPVR